MGEKMQSNLSAPKKPCVSGAENRNGELIIISKINEQWDSRVFESNVRSFAGVRWAIRKGDLKVCDGEDPAEILKKLDQ